MDMKYRLTKDNLKIYNGYTCTDKAEMTLFLSRVKKFHPNNGVFKSRKDCSIINEWRAHNLAYDLNLCRDRAVDVDIEANIKWWKDVFYAGASVVYIIKEFFKTLVEFFSTIFDILKAWKF